MRRSATHVRAILHGLITTVAGCPSCTSADIRPSRRPAPAAATVGLHPYRCRACGERFWLRDSQVAAMNESRDRFLRDPAAPEHGAPQWTTPKQRRPQPLPDFDLSAAAPPLSEADLTQLDRVLEDDEEDGEAKG